MKKVLFAAIAAISVFTVNAQRNNNQDGPGGDNPNHGNKCENCEVSRTPNGEVKPVNAQYKLELGVHKVICVTPRNGGKLSGRINSADELNDGSILLTGNGDNAITFDVSTNVLASASLIGGLPTYYGAGAGAGINPFKQKLSSASSGVTISSIASTWFQLGTMLNAATIAPGVGSEIDITAAGVADWTTPPGVYEQTNLFVVTAL